MWLSRREVERLVFFDNMDFMNQTGKTVFLDVYPDVLFRRLRVAKQQRPILQGKEDDELKCSSFRRLRSVLLSIIRHNMSLMQTNWKTVGRLKHRYNACNNFLDYKNRYKLRGFYGFSKCLYDRELV